MEDRRSSGSGFFDVERADPQGARAMRSRAPSAISLTAALCVGVLVIVLAWSITHQIHAQGPSPAPAARAQTDAAGKPEEVALPAAATPSAASSEDISDFGAQVIGAIATQYSALHQQGTYSEETGAALVAQIAPAVKAPIVYRTFSIADLFLTNDTSAARIAQYQADLRVALAPLSQNTTPEISLFALYTKTKDTAYLEQLRTVAAAYVQAAAAAARVQVPTDALAAHVGILNAMEQFSATLEALADNAQDPMAVMAILNTYNDAESNMVVSFNSFALYIQQHMKS